MTGKRAEPDATPALGSLDGLDFSRSHRPSPGPPPPDPPARRGWWPWVLLAIVALAAVAALLLGQWREQLGYQLVPASAINQQITEARAALARGELSAPDGSGARERFQAVLARDPDHLGARSGLGEVRDAALAQARDALAAGEATAARDRIALARSMAAPAADLSLLEIDLQRIESTGADVADKLERARAAQAQGHLEQVPNGALALYSDVLRLQPDNALALEGRREILSGLLREADAALARGETRHAEDLVARVVASDPSHLELPAVRARLGEVQVRRQQASDEALRLAATNLRAGRVEAAAAGYQTLLEKDPAQVEARQGLEDAAAVMAARAGREAADFNFDAADATLALARTWHADSPALAAAERRFEQARASRDQLPLASDADPSRQLALVEQARAAMRRGDLIDPPGESAWDYLRQASAMGNAPPALKEALLEYDRRARACFEDQLAGNRLVRAPASRDARAPAGLGARAVRERSGDGLAGERRRLADRWLAFADERLGANELALARRALQSAQALDPAHPGLAPLSERLARAGR